MVLGCVVVKKHASPRTTSAEEHPMDPLQAFRLDGQVVIVTGATSGLGVGFARAIASAGGQVVLAGRRAKRLRSARDFAREEWPLRGSAADVLT